MIIKDAHISFDTDSNIFIIAELSANHNQSLDLALQSIKAIKESGANAIKIQTYTPDTITIDCNNDHFLIKHDSLWKGNTLYELYKKAYTPWDWHEKLQSAAHDEGLIFFSSPFDFSAVDYLEKLNVPLYKIASPEITDIPLIRYVAQKQKPIIISTGIATLAYIEEAIKTCYEAGNKNITLLHCTTAYPTPMKDVHLNKLQTLKKTFDVIVGISDHTMGSTIPIASVALGARVIEKHFIINGDLGGPDAEFSMDQSEFASMVSAIRDLEVALGKSTFTNDSFEDKSRQGFSARSLFVVKDMKKGEEFTPENIRSIRPGYGMHTRNYYRILGLAASTNLKRGTPLKWEMLAYT